MELIQYNLPNGIRCILKQVRSAVAHCALTVNTGSRDELPSEYGLAHLLEHSFFKGTTHRKAYHINCRLENLGGELNAYTTKEETVIHTTTLKGDVAKAAELIADIVFHSVFPQKEIDKEKSVIIDEINSYKDTPFERIFDDFEDMIFAGTSLGHNILGSKSSLMRFNREDLLHFIGRTYNTDQMVFSIIGNISPKRFTDLCNRYFADASTHLRNFERDRTDHYQPDTKTLHRSSHQGHCIIGNRAYNLQEEKRIPLSLLTNMLGGPSANSLLNLVVRERNGLTYTIEAGFTSLSDTGISTIYFGCDRDNIDVCIELIHKELDKLKRGEITPHLLAMAKKQYIGQMTIAMENNESYMLSAARNYLYYNQVETIDSIRRKIQNVTIDNLVEVAQEIYGNNLSTLIYR